MSLVVKIEDFGDFTEFNDSSFNLDDTMEAAIQIVEDLWEEHQLFSSDFNANQWKFINSNQQYTYFNFNEINNIIQFQQHTDQELIQVVKCWIATNLEALSINTVRNSFTSLIFFLKKSHSFLNDVELLEDLSDELMLLEKSKRYSICIHILNFIQFYEDIDPEGLYGQMLLRVKETISYKELDTVRILPSSKDLIFFHSILTSYFEQLAPNEPNYHRFFPVALWWKLSTIIPLRPFEFCRIPRDGVFPKDGTHYIHLPRSDKKGSKNKKNIQIIKDIPITEEMYQFINTYIENTTQFGETKTLISYKSVEWANKELGQSSKIFKIDREYFSYRILYTLLDNFYRDVVSEIYNLSVNPKRRRGLFKGNDHKKYRDLLNKVMIYSDVNYQIESKVSLGDTRHMALLNLQRLGYHPIEMARLAGHANINTQYAYHSHQQNWVDTEILKLMTTFKFDKKEESRFNPKGFVGWELKDEFDISTEWRDKFVLGSTSIGMVGVKKKLNLGYCTDEYQRCPVNDCAEGCDYWRISLQEYKEKQSVIQEKIRKAQNRLNYVVMSLLDLHKYAIKYNGDPEVSVDNLKFNQRLLKKSAEIDECVHRLAELMAIEGMKVDNE